MMSKDDRNDRKLGKDASRYQGGAMKLPEGSGKITSMCAGTGRMLLFTETATYRIRTPAEVDPDETDPDAPWVSVKYSEYGSANPVVARTYLQGSELISRWGSFLPETIEKNGFMTSLDSAKESLIQCYQIQEDFTKEFEDIVRQIESGLVHARPTFRSGDRRFSLQARDAARMHAFSASMFDKKFYFPGERRAPAAGRWPMANRHQ